MTLRRTRDGFVVDAVKPRGVDRPWSPALAGENDAETTLISRPATSKGVDATPSEVDVQADE